MTWYRQNAAALFPLACFTASLFLPFGVGVFVFFRDLIPLAWLGAGYLLSLTLLLFATFAIIRAGREPSSGVGLRWTVFAFGAGLLLSCTALNVIFGSPFR